jgi:transcriptional regulator with XRE-family HTH domain
MSGNPIRAARIAKGLTQGEVAKEAGVSRTTVARWESNGACARKVDRGLVPKVSEVLGLPRKVIRADWAEVFE